MTPVRLAVEEEVPAAQGVQTRSDVAVDPADSKCPGPHTPAIAVHTRSEVEVSATVSYWYDWHAVREPHTLFAVCMPSVAFQTGAVISYSPAAQASMAAHCLFDVGVGAALWYCAFEH